jgi:hypothetical protein
MRLRLILGRDLAVHQVQTEGLDLGGCQDIEGFAELAVRTGHQQTRAQRSRRQLLVCTSQSGELLGGAVLGHRRLVQLNTGGAGLGELLEELLVLGQKRVQQVEWGEVRIGLLGGRPDLREQEQRNRSHDDGAQFDAARLRTVELVEKCLRVEREHGVRVDLGLTVVVVRAEEAHKLERREVRTTACHREVEIERIEGALERLEPLRHGAEEQRVVEHVIVEGESVARNLAQSRRSQFTPGRFLEFLGDREECVLVRSAVPVGLEGALELTARPDARIPQDAGAECCSAAGHAVDLSNRGARAPCARLWSLYTPQTRTGGCGP